MRQKGNCRIAPFVEEDARVGNGGAARGIGGNGANGCKGLIGAPDKQQRAHFAF